MWFKKGIPDTLTTNDLMMRVDAPDEKPYGPFKRLLYDDACTQELLAFCGDEQTLQNITEKFMYAVVEGLHVEQNDLFAKFVSDAQRNAESLPAELSPLPPFQVHVLIATPVNTPQDKKDILLTALYNATVKFFETHYKVKDLCPLVYDLCEPEMALTGTKEANILTPGSSMHPQNRVLVVFDLGGSTYVR